MSDLPLQLDFCPNFSGWLIGKHHTEFKAIIYRSRCGQWDCEYCCERNRLIWRARIIRSIDAKGGEWFMVTLTAHQKMRGQVRSLKNLQSGWSNFVCEWWDCEGYDRKGKRTGKWRFSRGLHGVLSDANPHSPFEYVRVYEPHADGSLHMHMLTNYHPRDYVHPTEDYHPGSRMLKDMAAKCGLGYEVQIKLINGHAGLAAAYVTKYITKNLANLPKGTRRIETSNHFLVDDESKPSDYEWRMSQTLTRMHLEPLWDEGYTIKDPAIEHTVKPSDFENTWVYMPYKLLVAGKISP